MVDAGLTRTSARDAAYRYVREEIIHGHLLPGAGLSENELASLLGTSRQPVREALLLIAQEGLVEVRPQSGTYVASIDPDRVRDAQFIREAIEVTSLASVESLSVGAERGLRDIIAAQRAAADRDEFYPLDERFHRALLGLAGHSNAWAAISSAKGHLDRARYVGMSATRGVQEYVDDHEGVVDALARGDSLRACELLRQHLRLVFVDLEEVERRQPELFRSSHSRAGRSPRR
ncbi:GntR family transcriptional regulator [Microbacterium esteraromaticum]|uniref:GntR family transcriptional regulator n=1 Tax=Microbacterium esteraromaticum TaxID=57043 RepID=UPI0019D3FDE9|nr:GntR family transcriptional regulator [Microbacterium esteraromaticum]MBN7793895.1 GntR family transcriptional regulator [Microbacterium esteraromaticum]MCA1307319.1 GntR family transcriptional regulator [Microbacterium esteraromaticum]